MKGITKQPSEHQEQCAVFTWANMMSVKYPCLEYMFGTLNGVRLSIGNATKMKRSGNKKGVPDIILPFKSSNWSGLFIELKIPGGTVKPEQKDYIAYLKTQGYFADVRVGSVEAIDLIIDYLEGHI